MMNSIKTSLSRIETELKRLDRRGLLAALRPGVSTAYTRSALRAHGLDSNPQLESVYLWRNGTDTRNAASLGDLHLFPGFYLLSVEDALVNYSAFSLDPRWYSGWLPVFGNGGGDFYVTDLSTEGRGSVRHFRMEESDHPLEFIGLGAMLATLAAAFEARIFYLDHHGYLEMEDEQFGSLAARMNPGVDSWAH